MDFSAHHSVKLVKIRISQASHSVPTCMGCAPECSQSRVTWQTSRLKQGSTVVDLKAQLWTPIQRSSDTFIAASAKPPCCASMQCSLLKRNHCTIKASTMHYALCTIHSALCIMHYAFCTMQLSWSRLWTQLWTPIWTKCSPVKSHLYCSIC